MGLLSDVVWLLLDLTILLLLLRAARGRFLSRYPYYYGYLLCILCSDGTRILFLACFPRAYAWDYWISQIVTALAGLAVTWEIYAGMFSRYGGVRRMARAILSVLSAAVILKAAVALGRSPIQTLVPTTLELERNLRVVQALFLLALIGLLVHYAIPMGRNLRWMLLGYGFYIGFMVILRTALSELGAAGDGWWSILPESAYCVTLILWCLGMWSYVPNPLPGSRVDRDYDKISAQTSRAFGRLRNHLTQSWRA